jgi:hypothetical protein
MPLWCPATAAVSRRRSCPPARGWRPRQAPRRRWGPRMSKSSFTPGRCLMVVGPCLRPLRSAPKRRCGVRQSGRLRRAWADLKGSKREVGFSYGAVHRRPIVGRVTSCRRTGPMKLCAFCHEPNDDRNHEIAVSEARMYGTRPCTVCGHPARVICSLGPGDFAMLCPSNHKSGTSTLRGRIR